MFSLLIAFVHFTNFRSFHHWFFWCFYFTTNFYYCFSPIFFTLTVFLSDTSFSYCCTASATDWRELVLLSGVFYLTLLPHICHSKASATDLRELFYPQEVSTLRSFPILGTTYFYQGFTRSQHFLLQDCRAYHWGSKQRPGSSACLNYTEFSKRC